MPARDHARQMTFVRAATDQIGVDRAAVERVGADKEGAHFMLLLVRGLSRDGARYEGARSRLDDDAQSFVALGGA